MADPERSSNHQNQDRNERERVSSPLPLSSSTSLNDSQTSPQHQHHNHHPRSPLPPPVKARFSNLSDHIVKAARRLSIVSTPQDSYNPPPSPVPPRSGGTSPDINRNSNRSSSSRKLDDHNSTASPTKDSADTKDKKTKIKEKKPLVKMDLFNLKSRNSNSSQMNLVASPVEVKKSSPAPPPPSKDTYLRGIVRNSVCTEDDYRLPAPSTHLIPNSSRNQQQQQQNSPLLQQPSSTPQGQANFRSELVAHGHTDMHEFEDHVFYGDLQPIRPSSQEPFMYHRPTSPTPPVHQSRLRQQLVQSGSQNASTPPIQKRSTTRLGNTMGEDLSRLSLCSLQESDSGISDNSLQMEDVFEIYDSCSIDSSLDSRQNSMRNNMAVVSPIEPPVATFNPLQQQRPYQLENKPLSALERIQLQQKAQFQEQERLAETIIPSSNVQIGAEARTGSVEAGSRDAHPILPSFPGHSTASPQPPEASSAAAIIASAGSDSAMLDQLLSLVPGPHRPRLPSQIEWQRGFEELQQKRTEATALTSSLGRQNSSSSRHSRESSDGRGRRHSMPDMPHGQSREDQERQRGDNFRNPMLSPLSSNQRRSLFEDREQLLRQSPIQRQSIAESQVVDAPSAIAMFAVGSRQLKNGGGNYNDKAGKDMDLDAYRRGTTSPLDKGQVNEKDMIDMAFDDMLASLSLPVVTRTQLESLPKERKWAMLQSNDANPTLYQTPETMPPQFFVDALLEYSGKKKRSSRDLNAFNFVSSNHNNKSMGIWKNMSASNIGSSSNGGDCSSLQGFSTSPERSATSSIIQAQQHQSFQQQLSSLLGGKSEKRTLEEREQVLKKLRVLIRNGSIRWTGEFIKVGGPLALLQFCSHVQRSEETKLGQREKLLHQTIQCIRAIVPLEGGVESLVTEPVFFPLMRTLAINEAPILTSSKITSGVKSKTGFFGGGGGSGSGSGGTASGSIIGQQQRLRSSSIPKPIHIRLSYQTPFQPMPVLSVDQIPMFSNSQTSVGILTAILAREPERRDQILKETVADPNMTLNQWKSGDEGLWKYSEWITYLKEIVQVCGVEMPSATMASDNVGHESMSSRDAARANASTPTNVVSVGQGLSMLGAGPSASTLSLFSLDNMRRRKNSNMSPCPTNGGIKYEAGEDREMLAYLTTHLELISKLIFDMHISSPGLAFAKAIKESQLETFLEQLRSTYIQNQDLSAQIEDLVIQLSMVPSTTRLIASRLSRELPVIPPFDPASYQQLRQQRPPSAEHQYPLPDAKYGAQVVPKATASDIPFRDSSLDTFAIGHHSGSGIFDNAGVSYDGGTQRPMYGGGLARSTSQIKPTPTQRLQFQQQVGAGRTRKATVIGLIENTGAEGAALSGLGRQISVKRSSVDGQRVSSGGNNSPLPQNNRMSPANGFYQDLLPSARTTTTTRRATIGESAPITSAFAGSGAALRMPVVPPKNKNRPCSYDVKGRSGELFPKIQYTTVKLDQQFQQFRPGMAPRYSSTPIPQNLSKDIPQLGGNTPRAAPSPVPRSSSTDTFGNGRRSSLNSGANVVVKADSSDAGTPAGLPSISTESGHGRGLGHGHNNVSTDGTSTCSSTTSSGFSATSSNSSVSVFYSQTLKQSTLAVAEPSSSSSPRLLRSTNHAATAAALPPAHPGKPIKKEVYKFRDVDFDAQIQENVRRLASSSSLIAIRNQPLQQVNEDTKAVIPKLEIQATDPKVLEAPIVVPADISLIREQYIREQLSSIVLPPMEQKTGRDVDVDIEAISRKTKTGAVSRRQSVNSGIPVMTGAPSFVHDSNKSVQEAKTVFFEQTTSTSNGVSRLPQLAGTRQRSVNPAMPSSNNDMAKISDRIKMFERA
ncbi:hypothetical protein BC939DRAFT_482487 [Gamsiella multidivaricata]|uniref:uncharacterized protein n=1 Tax=Gamsiella multidivaricata TaxID=101098 RepID=UPI00221F4C27|nr:uncharacterized protein BC939DRAFT_482487 [Gamsiella multidivaricata]KAG0361454.1 hypothetical protein BGZ54_009090 [Gamsiella multidivaricata]KAI7815906.1 hypothetical protein BC939DRAFT_482487 [Gamsiella multidivaricata]